ncbi:MAG TPA: DUF3182 family protein [Burkholderiales bacterium]|nr:DUF3182 family protein [Burkholderiales bacterium]
MPFDSERAVNLQALTQRQRRTAAKRMTAAARHRTGLVVCYAPGKRSDAAGHEAVTRMGIAKKLAALKRYDFGGEYDPSRRYLGPLYFVPGTTLVASEVVDALALRSEDDLFGGVVPHQFIATKTITHPLVGAQARAPEGWSSRFTDAVHDAVLAGYSAFSVEDAQRAGARLLERGAVRVKPALAIGGRGQTVAADANELNAALAGIDPEELTTCGVVLEQNLAEVTTYSVGQVRVGSLLATYCGTQMLTTDNKGTEVYGGSALTVARGDFDALLALGVPDDARRAVGQARKYDDAARACFPGFFASRRNYDTVQGRDDQGSSCGGVLEQSWRIGGASGAEVGALQMFQAEPVLQAVNARCVEVYGESAPPPANATVYFRGMDEDVGFITKYTQVEPHVDA